MEDLTLQDSQPGKPQVDAAESGIDKAGDPADAAQKQRRTFFIAFGSVVFAGLALTALYVGSRVVETRAAGALAKATPPEVPAATYTPAPIAPAPIAPARAPAPIAPKTAAVKPVELAPKPLVRNEARKPEEPKPQLVAEVKPSPPPVHQPQPTAPIKAPPKPQPRPEPKPVTVAKAQEVPKPSAPPAAKSEPIKPASHPAPHPAVVAAIQTSSPDPAGALRRDSKPYDGPLLRPQPGQVYVQVGAYSPNYTGSFLAVLERKGFHGVVAAGPSQEVNRILVGPFQDYSTIKNTHQELGRAGLSDAFARKY